MSYLPDHSNQEITLPLYPCIHLAYSLETQSHLLGKPLLEGCSRHVYCRKSRCLQACLSVHPPPHPPPPTHRVQASRTEGLPGEAPSAISCCLSLRLLIWLLGGCFSRLFREREKNTIAH